MEASALQAPATSALPAPAIPAPAIPAAAIPAGAIPAAAIPAAAVPAGAIPAPAVLAPPRITMGMPLLRFRSDEQLVALFRAGHDEAFRAIHERYHKRLFAYARQMLSGRQDAEDALQDVFVRAYSGLRASDQELALRAWLFRVAHNRCIDELRRPAPPPPELLHLVRTTVHDPLAEVDLRESLRRLVADIRRLPEQQRSALLMRELVGMSYADLSVSLGISVGAVKSLLVRARVALAQAADARDTSCVLIREQLVESHDRGMRPSATARKHMRDCVGCKRFRRELRGMTRQLAGLSPVVGPLGILAKLGFSGGAGGGAAGGGGLALLGGGGATASAGGVAVGVNHLATILVAAVATAGGAVELQHAIVTPVHHPGRSATAARHDGKAAASTAVSNQTTGIQAIAQAVEATVSTAPALVTADAPAAAPAKPRHHHKPTAGGAGLAPSTGASGLTDSSTADGSTPSGVSSAPVCSTATLPVSGTATDASSTSSAGSSGTATASPSASSPPTTSSSATSPATPTTPTPCVQTVTPITDASTPTDPQTTTGSNPSSTSSAGGSSSGSTASSSSSSTSGSTSTASSGGSASVSK